jgi:hypothetical protein
VSAAKASRQAGERVIDDGKAKMQKAGDDYNDARARKIVNRVDVTDFVTSLCKARTCRFLGQH